jgi:hypothetical protein
MAARARLKHIFKLRMRDVKAIHVVTPESKDY